MSRSWFKPLLVSPSLAQTVGLADWVGLPNPHSCRYCGTNPGFDFLLVSLTWFKPAERLSLANRWMCQYPYGKNTGVRTMVQTGGKLTCRNSKTARNDSDQLGLDPDPVVIHVSQPLLVSLSLAQTGGKLSVANGWMCFSPYCKDSGFRLGSRTGGKLTCRNSKTARNREFVVVFARSEPVNPVPYCGLKRRNP